MSKNKTVWLALLTMLLCGSLFPMVKLGFSVYAVESTADILLFAGIRFVICGVVICLFATIKDKASYRPVKASLIVYIPTAEEIEEMFEEHLENVKWEREQKVNIKEKTA